MTDASTDTRPAARRTLAGLRARTSLFAARTCLGLAIVVAWQAVSDRLVPEYYISNPLQISKRLVHLVTTGAVWPDFSTTAQEFVLGYILGIGSGLTVGIFLGALPRFARVVEPVVTALNGIPKIALAPLLVLWLGIGLWSKVGIAMTTVFFVMFYNTYVGMRTVPTQLVNALRIMGAGRATVIRRVLIPQMSAPIVAGLKAGIPFTAIGVVVGEFVASDRGLGYYIRASSDNYDAAGIYSGIILLMVLIALLGVVVGAWERRVMRWRR